MNGESNKQTEHIEEQHEKYNIFESMKQPICVLGTDGLLRYSNKQFSAFFQSCDNELRLDWSQPLFPEYRKRVAQAYLSAKKGIDKNCFAIVNSNDGQPIPVEIYLFPLVNDDDVVTEILVLFKIVDNRLLSFDHSTLSLISEENFQYDTLHFEFSPYPILRVNDKLDIIKCSHSSEGFFGFKITDIAEGIKLDLKSLFMYEADNIIQKLNSILSGELSFQRLGEIKVKINDEQTRIVNLIIYPIVQEKKITSIEIIFEDITDIKELKEKMNSMNRARLLTNITTGFLHSLNNTMNVILNKTQLLSKINEKKSVTDGMQLIEESVNKIVEKARQVQNFITPHEQPDISITEPIVDIIEDAIEFFKMQSKIGNKEQKRKIVIERKYFSNTQIKTDTRLLRELIISNIMKVSGLIQESGSIEVTLKGEPDITLTIATTKTGSTEGLPKEPPINIFSGVDIREVADRLGLKIIEKESNENYELSIVIPSRLAYGKFTKKAIDLPYKIRDLDILLVEDDESLKTVLYEFFDSMGNRVFVCTNGLEALNEFKRNSFDIVITDYGIEEISGIELAAKIKELNEKTPTVLLSGWMLNDINTYKNVIDLFIPKPFKLDELIKQISKLLSEKTSQRS